MPPRRASPLLTALLTAALLTAAVRAAAYAAPAAAPPADPAPLAVMVTASTDESGARVTLTFSRKTSYRLEESRSRLRLILGEPLTDASLMDRDLDSDVMKRFRINATGTGAEVVFYLGRRFATFSSAEQNDPFRVTLQFQREGAAAPAPPADATPPGAGPAPPAGGEAAPPGAGQGQPAAEPSSPGGMVMIDPGHGGAEEGAVSHSGLKEKDLVLDIARRLRSRLGEAGIPASLTREEDDPISLTERTARANHAKAALFLSIHANSSVRAAARGAETYFLSYGAPSGEVDEQAMTVARQENLAGLGLPGLDGSGGGGDGGGSQGGGSGGSDGEPAGDIKAVLWDLAQSGYLSASSRLAGLIQSGMNGLGGMEDRGVKQAPFRVLVGAAMPAALVEVGFLTNDEEETRLATQDYRDQIAQALSAAVQKFLQERDREEGAPAAAARAPR